MKTPTLIVRLLGLYLITSSAGGIWVTRQVRGPELPAFTANSSLQEFALIAWASLFVGIGVALFAGPLARVLTFDAEPKQRSVNFSDQLLQRQSNDASHQDASGQASPTDPIA